MTKNPLNYVLLRYHVPTAFGIPGMRAVITHRTGKAPYPDTVYVAVSESENALISTTFSHNDLCTTTKSYAIGNKFDFQKIMKGRRGHGPFKITQAEYERIHQTFVVKDNA